MKKGCRILLLVFVLGFLVSCNNNVRISGCPNGEIVEWLDALMINDVKYQHDFPDSYDEQGSISIEKGEELGKVTFMMDEHACSDHRMENGDATYLPKGTSIYEVNGYPSSFIVAAEDKVYVVDENKEAKTAGELYPLDGLVKNIYIESTEDGSRLHTFSYKSKEQFIQAWYQLELDNPYGLHVTDKFDGERIFLEIELNNGVSFRQLYWMDSNTFHNGAIGDDEIKKVIVSELEKMEEK
ncbi:hypothetical protein RGU12_19295 [Fredinandcohnia sp. QZ13]|uniref:hypothetical protein n=1 Tax=Fredinandcohnia sp. QZ13 TaxID=3073144 RepID=UPI0028534619|nr:hypothetical protein [Fredinandcohnia sp. QZ13]MDR4889643.1 hypothetical protein [Fredinandcohnia sp. QZ13]